MMSTEAQPAMEHTDTELVSQSLTGSREAFGRIVARYQSLICSLAYSATGSLTQSEDLAQETFVIAWTQLRQLRGGFGLLRGELRYRQRVVAHDGFGILKSNQSLLDGGGAFEPAQI